MEWKKKLIKVGSVKLMKEERQQIIDYVWDARDLSAVTELEHVGINYNIHSDSLPGWQPL